MNKQQYSFEYEVFNSSDDLNAEDKALLEEARLDTQKAYAPYSHFNVSAVAQLVNGEKVIGTNQENASYPVGICAERTLLAAAALQHPGVAIDTIAISYHNGNGESNHPVAPCGMCRQSLSEYQQRVKQPFRLILSGMEGKVFVIENADMLLPLSFSGDDIK
jgi:cytidine deaminase